MYNFTPVFRFHRYALKICMRLSKCCSLIAAVVMKLSVWLLFVWSLVSLSDCMAKHVKKASFFSCSHILKKNLKISSARPQGWNHRWFLENDLGTESNNYCHGDSLRGREEGEKYRSILLSIHPSVHPSFHPSFFWKQNGLLCCGELHFLLRTLFSFFGVLSLWQYGCWKASQNSVASWNNQVYQKMSP